MSDGPNGLRFQALDSDHLGINDSLPNTSFPTASAVASSWNLDLVNQIGAAIGQGANARDVDVVLGPGVNIKRNPLCGRNFEYFSEDPYLSGMLGSALVTGIQSVGIGACVKHFALNSQENERLVSNSVVDAQALHELYLEAFRIVIEESQPESIMCSYNLINGIYASENSYLLTNVLRIQWSFDGAVITDWGALNNKIKSIQAGTDLEMPSSAHMFDTQALTALEEQRLKRADLERAANKVDAIAQRKRPKFVGNLDELLTANAKLAQTVAEASAVLLKNAEDILPIQTDEKILLVGKMAAETRFQGAGSSHINATHHTSILEGMKQQFQQAFSYEQGYQLDGQVAEELVSQAVAQAKLVKKVVVVMGLPEADESEGFDRKTMQLPANQIKLIERLSQVNKNIVVVLVAGAPVELPFIDSIKGLLNVYLAGQEVGQAVARLLSGEVNPSGKLAETYPIKYQDVPSSDVYGRYRRQAPYFESIYAGYRYYDKAKVTVAFPFGYGLSYTQFSLTDFKVDSTELAANGQVQVSLTVTNTGQHTGSEVIQLYVGDQNSSNEKRPAKELKAFKKIKLAPHETQEVFFELPSQAFKAWSEINQEWRLFESSQQIFVGTSVDDIQFMQVVNVAGQEKSGNNFPKWYLQPSAVKVEIDDFKTMSGLDFDTNYQVKDEAFNYLSTPAEMQNYSILVKNYTNLMIKQLLKEIPDKTSPEAKFMRTIILDTPIIRLAQQSSGKLSLTMVNRLISLANHQYVKASLGGQIDEK